MANMGLSDLAIVAPRCDAKGEQAVAYAAHGRALLDGAAIVDDLPPEPTGLDGRMSVAVGLAAKKSLHEGRPVKVSEIAPGTA